MLDLARFQAGDSEELARAIDLALPSVWHVVRHGFVAPVEGTASMIGGVASSSEAEQLATRALGDALQPAARAEVKREADVIRAALEATKRVMIADAIKKGRAVSLTSDEARAAVPATVVELDRIIAGERSLALDAPEDVEAASWIAAGREAARAALGAVDEELRRIAELRFVEGRAVEEVAASLAKGRAFVRGRERRVRRAVRRAVRTALPAQTIEDAEVDLVLAPEVIGAPAITRERIRRRVLTRTFPAEPRPYAERLAWALGAAGLALALLVLGLLGAKPK